MKPVKVNKYDLVVITTKFGSKLEGRVLSADEKTITVDSGGWIDHLAWSMISAIRTGEQHAL